MNRFLQCYLNQRFWLLEGDRPGADPEEAQEEWYLWHCALNDAREHLTNDLHEHEWNYDVCMVEDCEMRRDGEWIYCSDGCCGEFIAAD